MSSKLLIFLDVTRDSITFCSRSFHPIRCGVLVENKLQRGSLFLPLMT